MGFSLVEYSRKHAVLSSLAATRSTTDRCSSISSISAATATAAAATDRCCRPTSKTCSYRWSKNWYTNVRLSSCSLFISIGSVHADAVSTTLPNCCSYDLWVARSLCQAWQTCIDVVFVCLFSTRSRTDLPTPDIVAAQGALVSVGSSYVTYIDKRGQVRCWSAGEAPFVDRLMRACSDPAKRFAYVCSFAHSLLLLFSLSLARSILFSSTSNEK